MKVLQPARTAANSADPVAADLRALLPVPRFAFALAWALLWVLMASVEVQDYWRNGHSGIWRPLVWQGTSCLVSTLLILLQARFVARHDALLAHPWRWFASQLRWLPLVAVVFVALVFMLRHGVYALLGERYEHQAWGELFLYESLKFSAYYLLFIAIFFGIRSYVAMVDAQLRAERSQALARQAQLLQLAQQIEPHFLFNALSTISEIIHSNPQLADTLLSRLAALLRAATDLTRRPESTLGEELRLLEGYAAIMDERFADRVSTRFEIDASLCAFKVPTLLLQPLLENAFRHGVEKHLGQAQITVRAQREGKHCMRLSVQDDVGRLLPQQQPVFGAGLSNLRERLATRFGSEASLTLRSRGEGAGVEAVIVLPCVC
ncbi:histidine kinase [Paucibacter sp. TC2R-5]|uniref:sensor histidine kinase n=1 Tax=Paucibacter sp. TC2R-5 TaxID=2893555 RepID=UPI0021E44673|nr:histidine kinase [Paucibacter sp. TC2R-5]MCV2359937.1 histidine kinase [Paucibacter sp. TC2R-5]